MRSSQNRLNGATRHRQASDIHPAQNGKAPKLPFSSNAPNSACLVLKKQYFDLSKLVTSIFCNKNILQVEVWGPQAQKKPFVLSDFSRCPKLLVRVQQPGGEGPLDKIWIWINSMCQFPVLSLDEHSLKSDKENTPRLEWNMPTQAQSLDHIGIPISICSESKSKVG